MRRVPFTSRPLMHHNILKVEKWRPCRAISLDHFRLLWVLTTRTDILFIGTSHSLGSVTSSLVRSFEWCHELQTNASLLSSDLYMHSNQAWRVHAHRNTTSWLQTALSKEKRKQTYIWKPGQTLFGGSEGGSEVCLPYKVVHHRPWCLVWQKKLKPKDFCCYI